jgi:hypothetical protein
MAGFQVAAKGRSETGKLAWSWNDMGFKSSLPKTAQFLAAVSNEAQGINKSWDPQAAP